MKYILFISMLCFLGCRTIRTVKTSYPFREASLKPDTTLSYGITGLQSGTYVYQFNPYLYTSFREPVSSFPLALLMVGGLIVILYVIVGLHWLYERIKKIIQGIFIVSMFCFYGCGEPYKKEIVVIEIGVGVYVDSITLINDTLRVYRTYLDKDDTLK